MKRFPLSGSLALCLALLASSCIGIDSSASIAANGSVSLAIDYKVSLAVDELGRLDANSAYLPLPVGRADLELASTRAGGQLNSWSRSDAADSFTIKAAISFPNLAAFASFMDPTGQDAVYSEQGARKTLSMRIGSGRPPANADLSRFVEQAFADYRIRLSFQLPAAIVDNSGFTVNGRTASFDMAAAAVYASASPIALRLTW
ncbi:MAG TPA: hypothetical protein DCG47_01690 [Spirochaetaceae bacterium]|nr:hypothetical protein [Spirochaetaceae bacterium]